MNIPLKYEDVVAQLEDSNKLCDSLERSMKNHRHELGLSMGREAALREEIEMAKQVQEATDTIVMMVDGQRDHWIEKCGLLKQRLTVAEQRVGELIGLLKLSLLAVDDVADNCEDQTDWATANSMHALSKRITSALKPAEGEGS